MVKQRKQLSDDDHWMNKQWRPAMAWLYLYICAADFIVFPILWSIIQAHDHGSVSAQWQPLTLQGGGLVHLAFGTILGISAYGRTQEKIAGVASAASIINSPASATYVTPAPIDVVIPSIPVDINDKGQKIVPQSTQPEL